MRRSDLPHVTDILRDAGLVDTTWFTEEMRDRGSRLHRATHYLDQGDLDWASVIDDTMIRRLRQYERFRADVRPQILSVEEEVENAALRYCGTLDRRAVIRGREAIYDIKGPSRAPWQALQVAMYAACFPRTLDRYTLHLSDERYQLIQHTDRRDWDVAKAAIALVAWKEKNGYDHASC